MQFGRIGLRLVPPKAETQRPVRPSDPGLEVTRETQTPLSETAPEPRVDAAPRKSSWRSPLLRQGLKRSKFTDWRPRTWPSRSNVPDLSVSDEGSFDSGTPPAELRSQGTEVFGNLFDLGDLESDYRRHHLADDIAQSRILYLIWLVASIAFIYFDYLVLGLTDDFVDIVFVRSTFALATMASILVFRRITNVQHYDWLTLGLSLSMAGYVYAINASRPSDYFANYIIDILMPLSMFLVIPSRLLFCSIAACTFSAADIFSLFVDRPDVPPMLRNVVIAANILAILMGFLVAARVNTYRRRAYRLYRDEISSRRLIEKIASVDDLTGSMTRRSFLGALEHELLRSRRFARSLTVIVMDLDAFKLVNDSHGHHAGDELLREFAATVASLKREIDVFGRLGGEEFCLMLPETPVGGALLVAERIRETWSSMEHPFEGSILRSTASMGVATLAKSDEDHQTLLRRADALLYTAKRAGRNRVVGEDGTMTGGDVSDDHSSTASATSGDMTGSSPRFSSS